MEKLIAVSADGDYGALMFEEKLGGLSLSEILNGKNTINKNNSFVYQLEDEDEDDYDNNLYITVSDVTVTDEVKEALLFLTNNDIIDYDSAKHNNYYIINE